MLLQSRLQSLSRRLLSSPSYHMQLSARLDPVAVLVSGFS